MKESLRLLSRLGELNGIATCRRQSIRGAETLDDALGKAKEGKRLAAIRGSLVPHICSRVRALGISRPLAYLIPAKNVTTVALSFTTLLRGRWSKAEK